MMATTVHSQPAIEQSIALKMQKIAKLRRVYVKYPSAGPIFEALDRLFHYGNLAKAANGSAECILLTGSSRSGKTALLNNWKLSRPASTTGDVDRRPIVYVDTPHNCTPSSLSRSILRALGVPNLIASRATNDSLLHQIKIQLQCQQVKVVIVDEVQHFIDSNNRKVIHSSADFLKSLLNIGLCSFVLAGIPSASAVVAENVQLNGRTRAPFLLSNFDVSISSQRDEYAAIIKAFGEQLPFDEPSDLHLVAMKLARATDGSLGLSIDLIVHATEIALDRNAKSLETRFLREALYLQHGGPSSGYLNPFDDLTSPKH